MRWLDRVRGLLALALLSLFGIIMLLLLDGLWAVPMFILACAPMIVGGWRAWQLARAKRALAKP